MLLNNYDGLHYDVDLSILKLITQLRKPKVNKLNVFLKNIDAILVYFPE